MLPLLQPQRARAAERRPSRAPQARRPAPQVPAPLRARPAPPPFAQAGAATAAVPGRGSAVPRLLPQPATAWPGLLGLEPQSPAQPRPRAAGPQEPRLLISH